MSAFNPSNGCMGSLCPPFTNDADFQNWAQAINNEINTSSSAPGMIKHIDRIISKFSVPDTLNSISTVTPGVIAWSFPNSLSIAYVDSTGKSSFAYNNDTTGRVQIVPSGLTLAPAIAPETAVSIPAWQWFVTACFVIIVVLILIVVLKKSRPARPSL